MSKQNRPAPSPMFADSHEDMPLFSGSPVLVEEKPWNPQPAAATEAPTADMFAEESAPPQLGALCRHHGDKILHGGTGNYVAECATCHVHGPIKKTAWGAKTALVAGVKGPRV